MNEPIIFSPRKEIKNKFLNFILKDPIRIFNVDEDPTISFTTFHVTPRNKKLIELYYENLNEYVSELVFDYELNSIWYQIYEAQSGSFHPYHDHYSLKSQVSGIYYLLLNDTSISTEFIIDGNPTQLNVQEGDVVLFDSRLTHRSPPNNTLHDKVIVSFNLNLLEK